MHQPLEHSASRPPLALEEYRPYLKALAHALVPDWLRGKLDSSDAAQDAVARVLAAARPFEGTTHAEYLQYLRTTLTRRLVDQIRRFKGPERDISRERSLDGDVEASIARVEALISGDDTGVELRMIREEEFFRVFSAVGKLPDDQREVVLRRFVDELTLTEIARRLDTTKGVVSGLYQRGLTALRRQCPPDPA